MPMKVRYETINGEVMSETRGGVHKQYIPDPLGSTVALMDDTQTITDTFSYWPYGEFASRTGTTPTPLQYGGTLGYYSDNFTSSYVRARYLDHVNGIWLTQDPIGFLSGDANLFRYVANNPTTVLDPTGLDFNGNAQYLTVSDFNGNAQCKQGCRALYKKAKDIKACEALCTSLGGNNCAGLAARCNHLDRHPSEGSATACWALYNQLCTSQPNPNPAPNPVLNTGGATILVCAGVVIISVLCALDPPCLAAAIALAAGGGLKLVTQ